MTEHLEARGWSRAEFARIAGEVPVASETAAESERALGLKSLQAHAARTKAGLGKSGRTQAETVGLAERAAKAAAERAMIVELARQGMAVSRIVARLRRSAATVTKVLAEAGIKGLTVAEANRAMVARLATSGMADTEIAEEVGLKPATVSEHRRSAGFRYSDLSGGRARAAAELSRQGLTVSEVAARLGLKKTTVSVYKLRYLPGGECCGPFLPRQARPPKRPARADEVADLFHEGLDEAEVAARSGWCVESVRVYLERVGLRAGSANDRPGK